MSISSSGIFGQPSINNGNSPISWSIVGEPPAFPAPDPPLLNVLHIPLEEMPRILTAIRWSEVPWAMELHDNLLKKVEHLLSTTGQRLEWVFDEYRLTPKEGK